MYYAYLRCSTQTQMENNGFQMQENVIAKYCSDNNLQLDGTFTDEGISGTRTDRDGLIDLLSTIEKGDRIIVQNTSRLWRSDTVKVMIHHELKKIGVDIISVEQPTYSIFSTDPNDFLFNGMMELLDQYERMTISQKLAKGRKAKAKAGNKACGSAPFGYKWDNAKIVIDYNNNMVVLDLFQKYLELKSLSKLLEYTKQVGYKTSNGNDFSKQALANILHNDFYVGIVTHAGRKVPGEHEPIIPAQLYDDVQIMLNK